MRGGSTCGLELDIPLISDFSYGEYIYSTIDGKRIRYYGGLCCDIWKFIYTIVCAYVEKINREKIGAIVQKIVGLVADRQNSEVHYTQDIYCPACHSKETQSMIILEQDFKHKRI